MNSLHILPFRMREALGEAARIQEAFDNLLVQKRALEAEIQELEEQQGRGTGISSEDKRALESEIRRLTELIETEQDNSEQAHAKLRRQQMLVSHKNWINKNNV